jgi:hypothetical protein
MASSENKDWKKTFQEMLQSAQVELKRATKIGKKMVVASHTTSEIHSAYESLGKIVKKSIEEGSLDWKHVQVEKLIRKINQLENEMQLLEDELQKIKKSK